LPEAGCDVTLLDGIPDPTGATPSVTPTGKPFEYGTRGFWKDYPNIESMLAEVGVVRRCRLKPGAYTRPR
jgi:hypothetical protein